MNPTPSSPIHEKLVESVPPGSLCGPAVNPTTDSIPRSLIGAIHDWKIAANCAFPSADTARNFPDPESSLKYTLSLSYSGVFFIESRGAKCCWTYASDPYSPSSSPPHSATRTVRAIGFFSVARIRTASNATDATDPLTETPEPTCQQL